MLGGLVRFGGVPGCGVEVHERRQGLVGIPALRVFLDDPLVRGQRVPVVGTVAMDAVMVDVTNVPGPPVTVDDEFTLIGQQGDEAIGAAEVAQWGNTISHEIFTAMSARVPRVYYAAAKAVELRQVASEPDRVGKGPAAGAGLRGGARAARSKHNGEIR